jgi:hypothetical protein
MMHKSQTSLATYVTPQVRTGGMLNLGSKSKTTEHQAILIATPANQSVPLSIPIQDVALMTFLSIGYIIQFAFAVRVHQSDPNREKTLKGPLRNWIFLITAIFIPVAISYRVSSAIQGNILEPTGYQIFLTVYSGFLLTLIIVELSLMSSLFSSVSNRRNDLGQVENDVYWSWFGLLVVSMVFDLFALLLVSLKPMPPTYDLSVQTNRFNIMFFVLFFTSLVTSCYAVVSAQSCLIRLTEVRLGQQKK